MIFIKENWQIILLVCLPVTYFMIRDLIIGFKTKKKLEQQKKSLIESEKKLEALTKKMEANKKMLLESLLELDVKSVLIEHELREATKNQETKPNVQESPE